MSRARDERKRLKRGAASDGGGHRAIVRLVPEGDDRWSDEALAGGVGKPLTDKTSGGESQKIGEIRRLFRSRDGWIMAEVLLDQEHLDRLMLKPEPGEFSLAGAPRA